MRAPELRGGGPLGVRGGAVAMVLGAVVSAQCGAAFAVHLFDHVGPQGAVFLRTFFAAAVLLALGRPRLDLVRQAGLGDVVLFALTFTGMNSCFYAALDRLPLGAAVTLEFVGPLGVAILGSRRRLDLIWAALAAAGILLLSGGLGSGGVLGTGALLALLAGAFWAGYILVGARVGAAAPGLGALAVAVAISALVTAPPGIAQGGAALLRPATLATGLAVGVLSSVVPYALELQALRRLPKSVFGIVVSMEPAAAAVIGFLALSQSLSAADILAISLVVVACAGALRTASVPPRDA